MRLRNLSLASLALAFCSVSAFATPIPATPVPIVTLASFNTGTAIATISGTGSAGGPGVTSPFIASYTETVYRGGTGALCPTCVEFVFTLSNIATAGSDPIERLTDAGFGAYTITAGYVPGTGVVPTDYTENGTGTVAFDFTTPNAIAPGSSADSFVIFTNATNFAPSNLTISDGTTVNVNGFMPSNAAPEPSSLALLGTGILSVAGAARRRFKK